MTAEACADMILRGMERRKRLVVGSLRGKLGRVVRIFAPGLIDRVANRAIERGRYNATRIPPRNVRGGWTSVGVR